MLKQAVQPQSAIRRACSIAYTTLASSLPEVLPLTPAAPGGDPSASRINTPSGTAAGRGEIGGQRRDQCGRGMGAAREFAAAEAHAQAP